MRGLAVHLLSLIAGVLWISAGGASPATAPPTTTSATQPSPGTNAAVIQLKGAIDDYRRDVMQRHFAGAKAAGARVIILEIDTYGGLVTAGLDISRFIKSQKDLHTIALVNDKAISAGTMVALACNEIVMTPGAMMGDCAPIVPGYNLADEERRKAVSPILADFDDSARNKYDPLLVKAFVVGNVQVHYAQGPDGEKKFVDAEQFTRLTADGWKPVSGVKDPIDGTDTLLTIGDADAQALGLSRGTVASADELASERGWTIARRFEKTAGDRIVEALAGNAARGILFVVFMLSLYIALSVPGHGAPEALAVISLALLLGMPLVTGYASWWELIIIITGLALLAFEIFVFPGHLVSGIVGALMVIGGLIFTFVGKEPGGDHIWPDLSITWQALGNGVIVVTVGLVCSLFLWFWLSRYLPKMPYFNRIILATGAGDLDAASAASIETGPAIGDVGVAVTDLKPGGSARFITESFPDGRLASVISDGGFVRAGASVIVREVGGNRIVVRASA